MSKEVTLTISDRYHITRILNESKMADLNTLAKTLDDVKLIFVTPEEWTAAGLKVTPILTPDGTPTGSEARQWDDKEELNKTVPVSIETVTTVLAYIKTKEDAKEITMADAPLITLKEKLQ